jgi:hypothetical protein
LRTLTAKQHGPAPAAQPKDAKKDNSVIGSDKAKLGLIGSIPARSVGSSPYPDHRVERGPAGRRSWAMTRSINPWLALGVDAWALGLEAASVIALRSLALAQGGARAQAEAVRMVAEKAEAASALAVRAAMGDLGATPQTVAARTVRHYRKKVTANRRRLTRASR